MINVRAPAVAGLFYPADRETLATDVGRFIANAPVPQTLEPKALIAPHAGYVYSGQVAANAYIAWQSQKDKIERIVLIGPSHRISLHGIAVPTVDAFKTPLGEVAIDREAIAAITDLPQIVIDDEPHRQEHSLEVHLPFLQKVLGDFKLLPLVVGAVSSEQVAEVIERLWGSDSTRFLISTDLSHFKDYKNAQKIDRETAQSIESMNPAMLSPEKACGCIPVAGMLIAARKYGLSVERLDLRNSGDTAGNKERVVGYGSWAACKKDYQSNSLRLEDDWGLLNREGGRLIRIAAQTVAYSIKNGHPPAVDIASFPPELQENRATFVTLNKNGNLRGCIGTVQACKPLIADVVENAYKAAMKDPRFAPIKIEESSALEISISLLSPFEKMSFSDEADFLHQLRPQVDGLIISDQGKRSVFLPQVWESLPEKTEFVGQLKQKAGMPYDYWSATIETWRFTAISVKSSTKYKSTTKLDQCKSE
ncbi:MULTISPECIES: AmmeMemoRadiSam system protein B [unclassified Prochlorococcus]|uniref:AmmeMemoRadiSam system protein B n=1 Tax=unclassified Prochlorococcus TaxID=2627481 RepID=UPI0005339AD7|nr:MULTISPECIES: AmmeMemoRadiSam system protein B [unclassified Prochlorococcus]KGG24370.1 putative dioxygenase [Prochlorococcus sp. MIT 0701]KGG25727.1 putative dioxygenase [Prochlorococcus sp. MIT 0702]KGG31978.1 putative dioxygenase [Prochlorococcus sp. MIT 0703]